jgi:hypothetical protein
MRIPGFVPLTQLDTVAAVSTYFILNSLTVLGPLACID